MDYIYYTGFTSEQFAADKYFQQWVLQASDEHDQFWNTFQNLYPAQKMAIREASRLVREMKVRSGAGQALSMEEKAIIKEMIFQRIEIENVSNYSKTPVNRGIRPFSWMLAVAAILIIVFVATYVFKEQQNPAPASMAEVVTGAGEKREIVLPDSSVVIVNANSAIRYSQRFTSGASREVFLEGNAFFKVRKNVSQQRFIVHANNHAVIVLGTEFNVSARSAATSVALLKGKVIVKKEGVDNKEEDLNPGEELKLDTIQQKFIKTKIDTQLYTAWTEGKWSFQQASLEDIVTLVRKYYGVNVVFTDVLKKRLKISAVIPVTDVDVLMQIISKTIRIKISKVNNQFVIQ